MVIGKLNSKVSINIWGLNGGIDAYGATEPTILDTYEKWANVQDKRGSSTQNNDQQQWNYDYKITMRYEKSRPTKSNYTLVYDNNKLQINSVQIIEEGSKRFEVLKCSVTEVLGEVIDGGGGDNGGGTDNGGGGSFDLPGGRYAAAGGTVTTVPNGWVSYSVNFDVLDANPFITTVPMGVYTDGNMIVDFGDGVLKSYPQGKFVIKELNKLTNVTITVWHDNTPDTINITDDYGGQQAKNNGYTGTLPQNLFSFNAANMLENMPTLPASTKQISIGGSSLSAQSLNDLLDALVANGLTVGIFAALTAPRSDADTVKINALLANGWQVTAWGLAPNL